LDSDLVPLCQRCHDLVHKLHKENEGWTLTRATRTFLRFYGANLTPRRARPKGQRPARRRQPKPEPPTLQPVIVSDKPAPAPRPELNLHPQPLIRLAEVVVEFGISKSVLHRQGYQRSVPQGTVERWRRIRPEWM